MKEVEAGKRREAKGECFMGEGEAGSLLGVVGAATARGGGEGENNEVSGGDTIEATYDVTLVGVVGYLFIVLLTYWMEVSVVGFIFHFFFLLAMYIPLLMDACSTEMNAQGSHFLLIVFEYFPLGG